MAINSDFEQKVEVFTGSSYEEVFVSNLNINESSNNPIPEFNFDFYGSEINSAINVERVISGNTIRITQEVGPTTLVFYCILSSCEAMRSDSYDIYRMTYLGEEDLLTRRRYFNRFQSKNASSVILEAINIHNENCPTSEILTFSGVEVNTDNVGDIVSNYSSSFEVIQDICQITGWYFRIENMDCKFFNPLDRLGLFNIEYNQNVLSDTMKVNADRKGIINVAIGEAYIYEDIEIEQTYDECIEVIFIDQLDSDVYEIVEPFKIIQPEEFIDVESRINLEEGTITFSKPLVYDIEGDIDDSRSKRDVQLFGRAKIRRRVLARAENQISIDQFGERFSAIQNNDSGDDLETVFVKLQAMVQERAFPVISGTCEMTRFGLRAGDFVSVNTGTSDPLTGVGYPNFSYTARITEIDHSTYKSEIRVSVSFSNSFFSGRDPMENLDKRVEILEKDKFDITRLSGEIIRETGYIFNPPLYEVNQDIELSENTTSSDASLRPAFETGMKIEFSYTSS